MKKTIILILAIFILFSINIAAEQQSGVPQFGIASNLFMNLFGLRGNEKIGILTVSEPVGKRDPKVWNNAANYPWIESLIFIFNPETMEYRYASYSPDADVMLKIHSQQPYEYNAKGFERYENQIQWINLNEQYILADIYPTLTIHSGYYKELTETFDALETAMYKAEEDAKNANTAMAIAIAARNAKQIEYNGYKTFVSEGKSEYEGKLVIASNELALTQAEVDKKGMELLKAVSERDAAEIEIEKLQQMVTDRDATISIRNKIINEQKKNINELKELLAASKKLEDPYKVRQLNLDRKTTTPYFMIQEAFDNSDKLNGNIIGVTSAALGIKLTNEKTGLTYALFEGFGSINTDEKWNAGGLMVISMPHKIFEFKFAGQTGTSGDNTYLYEGLDESYYGVINIATKLNIPYEDSIRLGAEVGIEVSTEESGTAKYINLDFELTPPNFPYLTFNIDQFSFANIIADNGNHLQRYKASAGFDINWSAGHEIDKDSQWIGNLYSWFFRVNYQILDNKTNLSVTDYFGAELGIRLLFK